MPLPSSEGQAQAASVHSQYSSSVSPFQAKTAAVLAAAMAAAAWSCVEKMLHEHQRTSAPSACSVSMSLRGREARWEVGVGGRGGAVAGPGGGGASAAVSWLRKYWRRRFAGHGRKTHTPVWIVMCSEPAMRAPLKGCAGPYSARQLCGGRGSAGGEAAVGERGCLRRRAGRQR